MVLTMRSTACWPSAATPGVMTARPPSRYWRRSSLSARMRSVLVSTADLQKSWLVEVLGPMNRPEPFQYRLGRCGLEQGERRAVQYGRCLFWVVAPFHGQHVAVLGDNDGFPPTGGQVVPGNHQVTDVDVVPGRGQAWCWGRVGELYQPVINGRTNLRHKAMTAGVDFADRQLGSELCEFRAVDLQKPQLHEAGGFGGQVNLLSRKRRRLGLAGGIEAKHDDGRRRIGVGSFNTAPGIQRGPLVAPC